MGAFAAGYAVQKIFRRAGKEIADGESAIGASHLVTSFVAHQRDLSLRDILVNSTDKSSS